MNLRSAPWEMVESKRMIRLLGLCAIVLTVTSCGLLNAQKSNRVLLSKMETQKLPNGLTVTLQQDASIPLVTLDMWVRAGGGNEPMEIAGVSHFLEHMLFKGTERLAVGEYDNRIESIGGYLNAATSLDYTHYYVTFPSEHFEAVITDFADVLQNSALDPGEVESERKVILEEISRKIDNPFGYLFDETIPALYSEGPYKHTVIGSRETVSALTRDQLFDYYKKSYVPNRMFLSVVGDIDPASAKAKIASLFTAQASAEDGDSTKTLPGKFLPPGDKMLPMDWNEAYFIIAFPGPSGTTMEKMAVHDFAETVLSGGRSSRLVNVLQEKKALVSSIGAYCPTHLHDSPMMIYGTCEPEKLDAVKVAVFEELAKLKADGIGDEEMRRVRRLVRNSNLFSLETNAGRAAAIGYSRVMIGSADLVTKYDEEIKSMSRETVEQFIAKYMKEDAASVFVTRRATDAASNRQ